MMLIKIMMSMTMMKTTRTSETMTLGRREVARALQEERRRQGEQREKRGGRRSELQVERTLQDERRDGRCDVEQALEEELSCFHETITQFHRF